MAPTRPMAVGCADQLDGVRQPRMASMIEEYVGGCYYAVVWSRIMSGCYSYRYSHMQVKIIFTSRFNYSAVALHPSLHPLSPRHSPGLYHV